MSEILLKGISFDDYLEKYQILTLRSKGRF